MTELPVPRGAYDAYGPAPLRYVLVHGVGGDRTQWGALAEQLAIRAGVLAIDLPGHGEARHVGVRRGSVASPPTSPRSPRDARPMALSWLATRWVQRYLWKQRGYRRRRCGCPLASGKCRIPIRRAWRRTRDRAQKNLPARAPAALRRRRDEMAAPRTEELALEVNLTHFRWVREHASFTVVDNRVVIPGVPQPVLHPGIGRIWQSPLRLRPVGG
jgi:hypothetical protein